MCVCAAREGIEETDLKAEDAQFDEMANNVMTKEDKHYVANFVTCECVEEENGKKQVPMNIEPQKCEVISF